VTGASRQDESVAARGARWISVAFVIVGLLNYAYSLMLTRLLNVTAYSSFAAGQSMILWASSIATVSVPWALAQGLARARSDAEREAALRFSTLASVGSGVLAAAIVGAIATRFGDSITVLTVAVSTFLIFLGTTTTGWLQGQQRMRPLSALYIAENVLKNLAGLLLVTMAGLRQNGALAAFGIGAVVMFVRRPRISHAPGRPWRAALANRDLWRRTLRVAGMQAVVSVFIGADVVLVAVLHGSRALAASYQASAALSRASLFIAGAVATAFFPLLSQQANGGVVAARAIRMYTAVALPFAAVLATTPRSLLTAVFPAQYGEMATLLKYTALVGLAAGGISLLTAFFQAADDYSILRWVGGGLAGYVAALLAGWRIDGVVGVAIGAALGTTGALFVLGCRLLRREGRAPFRGVSATLAESLVVAGLLIVLRPHLDLWLAFAALVGLRAGGRFLRPAARHKRGALWSVLKRSATEDRPAATGPPASTDQLAVIDQPAVIDRPAAVARPANAERPSGPPRSPISLLTDIAWQGTRPEASDMELSHALNLARRNRVEGCLARAYPKQLMHVLAELRIADDRFTRYLHHATERLRRAGIRAALIEDLRGEHICTSIDLVVSEREWRRAIEVLAGWSEYSIVDRQEYSARGLFYRKTGPTLSLHAGFAPFGVPAVQADRLLARARTNRNGILIPAAADYLRLRLACVLFGDLALDLAVLRTLRRLVQAEVLAAARSEAGREGWGPGFDQTLGAARNVMKRLDRRETLNFPVPVRVPASTADHAHRGQPRMGPPASPRREPTPGPYLAPPSRSGVMAK
jgi:O-antigen/teichoic acid export membrane protein